MTRFQTTFVLGILGVATACTPVTKTPEDVRVEITPEQLAASNELVLEPANVKKPVQIVGQGLNRGVTVASVTNVTDAEVEKAVAKPANAGARLGETIGSLGLLDRDGLWVRTPLVSAQTDGRVVVKKTGKSANITLLPSGGGTGAGSQVSLAAMQLLGLGLTDLANLELFEN